MHGPAHSVWRLASVACSGFSAEGLAFTLESGGGGRWIRTAVAAGSLRNRDNTLRVSASPESLGEITPVDLGNFRTEQYDAPMIL